MRQQKKRKMTFARVFLIMFSGTFVKTRIPYHTGTSLIQSLETPSMYNKYIIGGDASTMLVRKALRMPFWKLALASICGVSMNSTTRLRTAMQYGLTEAHSF